MNPYRVVLIYLAFFILLMALGGFWLFAFKTGLGPEGVRFYYAGDETRFIAPKSFEGLSEILWRHLAAFGVLIAAGVHLLRRKIAFSLALLLLTSALLNLFAPFLAGVAGFEWIKLAGFWGTIAGFVLLAFLLLFEQGRGDPRSVG